MRWTAPRLVNIWIWIALLLALGLASPPRVAFLRPPHFVSDQEPVTYAIQVEPNAANRWLIIAASDEEGIVRRSDEQLDGHSPKTRWVTWQSLPAGDLEVSVTLFDVSGQAVQIRRPLKVFGKFEQPSEAEP